VRLAVGLEVIERPENGSAVTIGTFDGVHLGHRALMARAAAVAQERGLESAVVTWDRHPALTLRPDRVPPQICSPERKVELIVERGLDHLVIVPFTEALSKWSPERFVDELLVKGLNARFVVVGKGWRFGHKATGSVDLLGKLGVDRGFDVEELELQEHGGEPISSSRIRSLIGQGRIEEGNELLARPFDVDGEVVHGDDRGRALGFPTANLSIDPLHLLPARGVYAGRARAKQGWYTAAINVGVNPTFGGDPKTSPLRVEAYLLDFDKQLYGQVLRLEFHHRLRDELKFSGPDDLVAQMTRDVERTRQLLEA
jgi:riboflavin kinase/FMN adenylyltransferase